MRKFIVIISCVLIVAGGVVGIALASTKKAATVKGLTTEDCVKMVKSLQRGGDKARKNAVQLLKKDSTWTLLDEIGEPDVDEIDKFMSLHLNAMLYEVASSKLQDFGNPKGTFVDGRDHDYNICLIEKCLAPGREVVYEMQERNGEEKVTVVEMKDGDVEVWLDGVQLSAKDRVFSGISHSNSIKLRLRNRRGTTVNFAIINEH